MSIVGPGTSVVAIDGAGSTRLLTVDAGSVSISGLTFQNGSDQADGVGGGAADVVGGSISLANCILVGNKGSSGGAIVGMGAVSLAGCRLVNNVATHDGGAIDCGGSVTLTNCTLNHNSAVGSNGGALSLSGTCVVQYCSFSDNAASGPGGNGGAVFNAGTTTLTDDIFWGDSSNGGGEVAWSAGAIPAFSHCDIQAGTQFFGISVDPMFVNATAGDLHLMAGSRCVAAGIPIAGVPTDKDGNQRPNPPSIGAYEGAEAPVVTPTPTVQPDGGTSANLISVTITDPDQQAAIYFTIDGSTPTASSTLYLGPIILTASATVTAIAIAPGDVASATDSDNYTVTTPLAMLHSFATGLVMISAPVDDSAYSAAEVFDEQGVELAVWLPALSNYAVSPTYPADTLRTGQGYYRARFVTPTNLLDFGPHVNPTSVALVVGWNMVGGPANSIAIASLAVTDSSNTSHSFADAASTGLVGATLYTFQAGDTAYEVEPAATGSLIPYEGYWLYASQPCTLNIPMSS